MGTGGGGGGGDLALNKPVTVTSVTQVYAGTNAVDGNDNTYWESASGFPQSIIIDLGSVQTVSSVVVKLPPPAAWATRTQTLTDGREHERHHLRQLAGPTVYTFNPATGNTVTITFPPTQVRYVRITFTSNSGSAGGTGGDGLGVRSDAVTDTTAVPTALGRSSRRSGTCPVAFDGATPTRVAASRPGLSGRLGLDHRVRARGRDRPDRP